MTKKFARVIALLLTLVIGFVLLVGCSDSPEGSYGDGGSQVGSIVNESESHKVVYYYNATIYTHMEISNQIAVIEEKLPQSAYVQTSEVSDIYATLVYRIKTVDLDEFISQLQAVGGIARSSITSQDVTSTYIDLKAQVSAYRQQIDVLEQLQASETDLTKQLAYIAEIRSVQTELNKIQSSLATVEKDIEFSTVTINLYQKDANKPFANIGAVLQSSWNFFVKALSFILNAVIFMLPFAIVAGIILLIVFRKKLAQKIADAKAKKANKSADVSAQQDSTVPDTDSTKPDAKPNTDSTSKDSTDKDNTDK